MVRVEDIVDRMSNKLKKLPNVVCSFLVFVLVMITLASTLGIIAGVIYLSLYFSWFKYVLIASIIWGAIHYIMFGD